MVAIGHGLFRLLDGRLEEYHDTGEVTFEAVGITAVLPNGHTLLDDISFSVPEKTLLAVVGSSGSGKSSLLAALARLRPASEGQVLYGGRDLYEDYAELQNRIGFVPQEDVLAHAVVDPLLFDCIPIPENLGSLDLVENLCSSLSRFLAGYRARGAEIFELSEPLAY